MAECIVVEGKKVELRNGKGVQCTAGVADWMKYVNLYSVQGMTDEPIADRVKWLISCGSMQICILELHAELRRIMWLDEENSPVPYGPEAIMRERKVATPYVILKVPFQDGKVVSRVEVFYRNKPLQSLDGPGGALYWPNLLNVSPNSHHCTAWFCTQYLAAESIQPGLASGLNAVVNHLWGGSFNRSSEAHEGQSTFGKAVVDGIDPRVTDIDRWEAESEKNPKFILSVEWRPTNLTVRNLIEAELLRHKIVPGKVTASMLANHLLRAAKNSQGAP